ncbi:hypothetical protein NCCP2222_21720 [Sporosarcina sp. NCCP-2222]|nr:hypothetical protein NCCP2222_21720 [Sporosarcina sp. NCCP-2222]
MEDQEHLNKQDYLNRKKQADSLQSVLGEIGLVAIAIGFFVVYFRILAYVWNQYFWNGYSDSISIFILIFGVIPLSYLSAKFVVKVIKITW